MLVQAPRRGQPRLHLRRDRILIQEVPAARTMCVAGLPAGAAMIRIQLSRNADLSVAPIRRIRAARGVIPAAEVEVEAAEAAVVVRSMSVDGHRVGVAIIASRIPIPRSATALSAVTMPATRAVQVISEE